MGLVREPIKKSSIKKKNDIIKKGFELICEKGYHNVTCVDIAKYAGVSTGIIYQYFSDKRDIFLAGIRDYSASILYPMLNISNIKLDSKEDFKSLLVKMIDKFIQKHTISKKAHEELMAMSCLDEEVAKIFKDYEIEMTEKIAKILEDNGFDIRNIEEKVHVVYGIMDNYCHEVVYHKHDELNYEKMKDIIIELIVNVLFNKEI